MKWNWELAEWPKFKGDFDRIVHQEGQFLVQAGKASAFLKSIDKKEQDQFIVQILSIEGIESSKIEGEILDRKSLQSSIKHHFGLQPAKSSRDQEEGMAGLLCHVYESFKEPLTHEMMGHWHSLLFKDQMRITDYGRYRTHVEPMQIVSYRYDSPKLFF